MINEVIKLGMWKRNTNTIKRKGKTPIPEPVLSRLWDWLRTEFKIDWKQADKESVTATIESRTAEMRNSALGIKNRRRIISLNKKAEQSEKWNKLLKSEYNEGFEQLKTKISNMKKIKKKNGTIYYKTQSHKWTDEQINFIRENKNVKTVKLQKELYNKFGVVLTNTQIKSRKYR